MFVGDKLVGYCTLCPAHGTFGLSQEEAWRVRLEDGLLIDDVFIQQEFCTKGRMKQLVKTSIAKAIAAKDWGADGNSHWVFILPADNEESAFFETLGFSELCGTKGSPVMGLEII